jgi:hypothetical protein
VNGAQPPIAPSEAPFTVEPGPTRTGPAAARPIPEMFHVKRSPDGDKRFT